MTDMKSLDIDNFVALGIALHLSDLIVNFLRLDSRERKISGTYWSAPLKLDRVGAETYSSHYGL